MRIVKHSVIKIESKKDIEFFFNDEKLIGKEGDSLAAALWANNIKALRRTSKGQQYRGIYCGIGNCYDCRVFLKGKGAVRACITLIENGLEFYSVDREDLYNEV